MQCDAVWCSVLQCVAVCCSVLQCVAISYLTWADSITSVYLHMCVAPMRLASWHQQIRLAHLHANAGVYILTPYNIHAVCELWHPTIYTVCGNADTLHMQTWGYHDAETHPMTSLLCVYSDTLRYLRYVYMLTPYDMQTWGHHDAETHSMTSVLFVYSDALRYSR